MRKKETTAKKAFYYAVVYTCPDAKSAEAIRSGTAKDGDYAKVRVYVSDRMDSQQEALDRAYNLMRAKKRNHDVTVATTVIKRTDPPAFMFANPKSLDMRAKFDRDLRSGKVEYEGN